MIIRKRNLFPENKIIILRLYETTKQVTYSIHDVVIVTRSLLFARPHLLQCFEMLRLLVRQAVVTRCARKYSINVQYITQGSA